MFFNKKKKSVTPHFIFEVSDSTKKVDNGKIEDFTAPIAPLESIIEDRIPCSVTVPYEEYIALLSDRAQLDLLKKVERDEDIKDYTLTEIIHATFREPTVKLADAAEDEADA